METKKKHHPIKTTLRQFKEFKTSKKRIVYLFMIIGIISTAIINFSGIYLTKTILDLISIYSNNPNYIYASVGIIITILIILAGLKALADSRTTGLFIDIRINQFLTFNKRFMEIDYSYMEDSEFLDRIFTSSGALSSDDYGFQKVYSLTYQILCAVASIILMIIITILISPWILIPIFFCAIVAGFTKSLITKNNYKKKDLISHERRINNYYYNTGYDFSYGKDIRMFKFNQLLLKKYTESNASYIKLFKSMFVFDFKVALLELVPLLIQDGLSYLLVIIAYINNQISIADLSMFLVTIASLSTLLRTFSSNLMDLTDASKYSEDYYNFIDDNSYIGQSGSLEPLTKAFSVEFKNVYFKYKSSDEFVLEDVSFKVNKGEKLAIVGVNGAGKTTIVKLISGLLHPTKGQILIDGIDIGLFNKDRFNQMFSVVFQDTNIFAASIIENVIGTNLEEEYREKGIDALKKVGLSEKIESLENKYDHQLLKIIDPNGIDLSGGQKQSIALARAIYKDAPFVILDEPTSALDALKEASIYQEFDSAVKNKTAIYVSHRLSSTIFCDKIALFDQKTLKEFDTHDNLLALKGIYYQMFITQGKYYQKEENDETVF